MDLNQAKEVVKKEIAKLIKFEGLVEDQQKLLETHLFWIR